MSESNFVDYVKIYCRSGKGGRGSTHMRRVKYNPNGGPDGGNGGRGGHIILRGNRNYWTLLHLRYDRHAFAGHGGNGSKNKSSGKDGEDKIIEVPCGTVVYNAETGAYLCDITEHGQEVILLRGGRGGLGNFNFATPTRQAPRFAQPGEPMQELTVIMELKLLADVGLVGFPNVGKSSLLSLPQCRQVYTFGSRISSQAQDCQLPIHNTGAQPWYSIVQRRQVFCNGRHSRYHRRSECRKRIRSTFLATHRAQLIAAIHGAWRCRRHTQRVRYPAQRIGNL